MTYIKNKIALLLTAVFLLSQAAYAGTSIPGPTGFLNVISTDVVGEGVADFGLRFSRYELKKDRKMSESIFSLKGNYGLGKNFEIGFEKSTDSSSYVNEQGIVLSGKFKTEFTENLGAAFGLLMDTDSNDYSSAYIIVGAQVAFFGLGVNFGGHSDAFNNMAHFGAYNFDKQKPENVFFLAGAELKMGISSVLIGYNSDTISIGVRTPIQTNDLVAVVGWQSESEYDLVKRNLPSMGDYETNPFTFGISGKF